MIAVFRILFLSCVISIFLPYEKMATSQVQSNTTTMPRILTTIPIDFANQQPMGLGINTATKRIYTTVSFPGKLIVIDGVTNLVQTNVSVNGQRPSSLAVNPTTNRVYVTNSIIEETLAVFDGKTNGLITTINIGSQPESVAANSKTNRIYVGSIQQPYRVSVVDGQTNVLITSILVGNQPVDIAINEATNRIYTANYIDNTVSVLDGTTNRVITTIPVGKSPAAISADPLKNRVYTANWEDSSVTVIDGTSNTVITTVKLPGSGLGIAINPLLHRAYVTVQSSKPDALVVLDTDTLEFIGTPIELASISTPVRVDPITNRIYVANYTSNLVTVLEEVSQPVQPSPKPVNPPTIPPLPSGAWNVPYYSQVVEPWNTQKMQTCGLPIGEKGCALTSLAMIFKYYGADQNPNTLNACLGTSACPMSWGSSTLPVCSSGKVRWVSRPSFSYKLLQQELSKGPVVLEISKPDNLHFVVVLGGSGDDPRNYTVNDPGVKSGERTSLSATLAFFKGYQPSSLRIFTGTSAMVERLNLNPHTVSQPVIQPLELRADETVSGTVALYRNTETDMVLELAAQSTASSVTEMQIWTEQYANPIWVPFSPYVSMPLDQRYYVKFRDSVGNTSSTISAERPFASDTIQQQQLSVYLPLTRR